MRADPKPKPRIKDPALLRTFSLRMGSCSVCGESRAAGLQAHHVLLRSRGGDDVTANLVALCSADHDAVHKGHRETRYLLGRHICELRPDTLEYLESKLGFIGCGEYIAREFGSQVERDAALL